MSSDHLRSPHPTKSDDYLSTPDPPKSLDYRKSPEAVKVFLIWWSPDTSKIKDNTSLPKVEIKKFTLKNAVDPLEFRCGSSRVHLYPFSDPWIRGTLFVQEFQGCELTISRFMLLLWGLKI